LEFLQSTGVKRVEAFGDSLLMVQQVFEAIAMAKQASG